jgi:hypothetical protein
VPHESTQIVSECGSVSFLRSKLGSHSTALFIFSFLAVLIQVPSQTLEA